VPAEGISRGGGRVGGSSPAALSTSGCWRAVRKTTSAARFIPSGTQARWCSFSERVHWTRSAPVVNSGNSNAATGAAVRTAAKIRSRVAGLPAWMRVSVVVPRT